MENWRSAAIWDWRWKYRVLCQQDQRCNLFCH